MKNISLTILCLFVFSTGILFSQTEEDRINFYDGVFFLAEEDYEEALAAFNKVYKGNLKENANINYLIGLCNLKIPGQKDLSIPYLEKAALKVSDKYVDATFKEESAPREAILLLGDAYRINEELDKAISSYSKYLKTLKENEVYKVALTNQNIESCKRAKEALKEPYSLQIENIGNVYNSRFNNFNPVMSGNGNAMAYMSSQRFYDAVIFVEIKNGRWSNPINITPQLQSDGDQYVTSLSLDGTTMYLSKTGVDDADIMVSYYQSNRWTRSENIGKPVNSKYFESHASISPDGKTLYFLSNRKGSIGQMDIFKSVLNENGKWSEPENLGTRINTILNEDTPVIGKDGKTLYFSSQGHSNIGGYDIFTSTLNDDGTWSEPVAMPYPLNTTDDNLFFQPGIESNTGYMARIEKDGLGGSDIYMIRLSEEPMIAEEMTEPVEEIAEAPDTTKLTEEVVEEVVEEVIEIEEPIKEQPVTTAKYHIKPIFFDFDSWTITDISKSKLDEIKTLMDNFTEFNLKVMGHTDSKGPDSYNQYLSEQRARSVFNYLVANGVDKSRLSITGYGEKQPAALNTTADGKDSVKGRQLNRRVEFKISVKPSDMIIIDPIAVPDELKIK